jgi:hypothetical protein
MQGDQELQALSDRELLSAYQIGGLRMVAIEAIVFYMQTVPGDDGMFMHVVVPVNKSNQGPATGDDFDHWACWCGDEECLVGKYGKRPEWLVKRGLSSAE